MSARAIVTLLREKIKRQKRIQAAILPPEEDEDGPRLSYIPR